MRRVAAGATAGWWRVPERYDGRTAEYVKPDGRRYWHLQYFLACDCPDCAADGHWMSQAGSPKPEDRDKWIASGSPLVTVAAP